jgi:hypothetical protein
MPGFGYHPKQIFCADDYTRTALIVATLPATKLEFAGFIIEYSGDQENQRKNAAEPNATAPIASKTRQTRRNLSLLHFEFDFA